MPIFMFVSFLCCVSLVLSSAAVSSYWLKIKANHEVQKDSTNERSDPDLSLPGNDDDVSMYNFERLKENGSDFKAQRRQILRKNRDLPGIAWLMSFPNSGTSFTMHLVGQASKCTVATNYGIEYQFQFDEYKEPVPLSNKSLEGPFLLSPEKPLPPVDSFIMTKTHCGGYCTNCSPDMYIETKHSFKSKCAQGSMMDLNQQKILLEYDFNDVERAIHLVRDPFNNIVSNFHLDRNKNVKQGKTDWLKKFPNNASGFKRWCRYLDNRYATEEVDTHFLPNFITKLYKDVPCHTLFYLFADWHNLSRQVTEDLNLPTLVIHYEDYEHNFESTVSSILDFLNLPRAQDPIEFISGKEYTEYFTLNERLAAKKLVHTISDDWTWNAVSKYFP